MKGSDLRLLLARKHLFGVDLNVLLLGWGRQGPRDPAWERWAGRTHTGFFLVPKGQTGYSSEVLVTEIKRNSYLNKSGLLETNKEKSLLYIKGKVFNTYLCKRLVSTSLRARLAGVSVLHPACRPGSASCASVPRDKSACLSVASICVFVKLCPKISALCCDDVCSQ